MQGPRTGDREGVPGPPPHRGGCAVRPASRPTESGGRRARHPQALHRSRQDDSRDRTRHSSNRHGDGAPLRAVDAGPGARGQRRRREADVRRPRTGRRHGCQGEGEGRSHSSTPPVERGRQHARGRIGPGGGTDRAAALHPHGQPGILRQLWTPQRRRPPDKRHPEDHRQGQQRGSLRADGRQAGHAGRRPARADGHGDDRRGGDRRDAAVRRQPLRDAAPAPSAEREARGAHAGVLRDGGQAPVERRRLVAAARRLRARRRTRPLGTRSRPSIRRTTTRRWVRSPARTGTSRISFAP